MIREIQRPHWVFRGVKPNHRHFKEIPLFGADTETVKGEPYTFQLYGQNVSTIQYVNRANVLNKFCDYIYAHLPSGIIYFHNLEFDLPVLFFPFLSAFKDSTFVLYDKKQGFSADILFGKVNYCKLGLREKQYELVDTFSFFKTSLAKLAQKFDLPGKVKKPRGLGSRKFTGKERKAFEVYAMRDAEVTYGVGKKIREFHAKYDVINTMSAPQLSARIFRHKFIPEGSSIPACDYEVDVAAVLSFHGGKNGLYADPGIYEGVRVYDINSAYPYAFTQLPNFLDSSFRYTRKYEGPGIYCVSGVSQNKPYNVIRNHNFEAVIGPFDKLWLTSYELDCAIRHRHVAEFRIHEGYEVVSPRRSSNPLLDFALHFYEKKQNEKGTLREFYKIMLNSLYGKFIQNVASNDTGESFLTSVKGGTKPTEENYVAGGLWNPMVATLVTGYVRAYLTDLEERYKSLHSSTDSIMTKRVIKESDKLGGLALKAYGTALLIRPKLYLLWDKKREVTAYATHGYHGSLKHLVSMLRSGRRKYAHPHMFKVRESFKQKRKPLVMETLFKSINIPIEGKLTLPALHVVRDGKTIKL